MPDHLRALVVILIVATLIFVGARIATSTLMANADFIRRRNIWLALTLVSYLSHSFWVCLLVVAVLLSRAFAREHNPLALYFFVLFAIPPLADNLPGLGIVNYLFSIDYLRVLSLAVLFPAARQLLRDRDSLPVGRGICDKLLFAYVGYNLALIMLDSSFTNFMRSMFIHVIDILLPYYVASRSLRCMKNFRDALTSFVVAAGLIGGIGIFEATKGWLLYAPLKVALDNATPIMDVLLRDGTQRAMASSGQPIVFGYVMVIAIGFWLYLRQEVIEPIQRVFPLLLLVAALIAALSRGPWVGAVCLCIAFVLAGPQYIRGVARLTMVFVSATICLLFMPGGEKFLKLLPFIGETDSGSVSYRQQLIDVFVPLIIDNPFFGAYSHFDSDEVEAMRQGAGIIDVVNSFIGVGLRSGLVGLSLFTLFFLTVGTNVWLAIRRQVGNPGAHCLGRALLAVLVGIIVTILTVSSIAGIPYIYWAIAGICVAYVSLVSDAQSKIN